VSNHRPGKVVIPNIPCLYFSGPGVVQSAADEIIVAPFNDIEAVSKIVEKNYNDIAAIILEPVAMNMGLVIPKEGFLETLRKLSDEYNIVLIFDEIKTGSKHYGGASSYFNVKPDLMTLGKAIAGGFPLSVVGGKKEIMSVLGPGKHLMRAHLILIRFR